MSSTWLPAWTALCGWSLWWAQSEVWTEVLNACYMNFRLQSNNLLYRIWTLHMLMPFLPVIPKWSQNYFYKLQKCPCNWKDWLGSTCMTNILYFSQYWINENHSPTLSHDNEIHDIIQLLLSAKAWEWAIWYDLHLLQITSDSYMGLFHCLMYHNRIHTKCTTFPPRQYSLYQLYKTFSRILYIQTVNSPNILYM